MFSLPGSPGEGAKTRKQGNAFAPTWRRLPDKGRDREEILAEMTALRDAEVERWHDGYVSGKHCRISGDDQGIYLEDLGSSNGTYMRVRSGQIVPFGSLVLIGQKLFQLERV